MPCLLDFYVLDTLQRQGVGLKLFEAMRAEYSLDPWQLAYDRPSPKLISFLRSVFYFPFLNFDEETLRSEAA